MFYPKFQQNCYITYFLLKTIGLSKLVLKAFKADNNKVVSSSSGKINKIVVNSSKKLKNNKSKKLTIVPNISLIMIYRPS